MALDTADRDDIARQLGDITREAGAIILAEVDRGITAHGKADGSLCSQADLAAEAHIHAALAQRFPGIAVIAEEATASAGPAAAGQRFFLVDPLDGTADFIAGTGDYTVNIALIVDGAPVAGAIYAPVARRLWIGARQAFTAPAAPGADPAGLGAWSRLAVRRAPDEGLLAVASLRHRDAATDAFLERLPVRACRAASSSLKFCVIAGGEADVYPRFGPTMEWDTAAGDAILRAAGGIVTDATGAPLRYGHTDRGYRNGPFIAWGDPQLARRMTAAG